MARSGIRIEHVGNFDLTTKWLGKAKKLDQSILSRYGDLGVQDTGLTASSWYYKVINTSNGAELQWCNSNRNNGVMIAIILQYGHGTGTGGYVQGRDYINPAIQPIFDSMADELWREMTG